MVLTDRFWEFGLYLVLFVCKGTSTDPFNYFFIVVF